MTEKMQTNTKYQCRTCENKDCEYYPIRENMSAGHDQTTGWRASPGVITFAVGCLSHSAIAERDAAIAQAAREDEREKVLSENPVLQCRQAVKDFSCLMEWKLKKNDHKKHWNNCNQEYLLDRLDQEVKELHDCFFVYSPGDMNFLLGGQHEDRIPGEAADVANFAMMLWDNFGEKPEKDGA